MTFFLGLTGISLFGPTDKNVFDLFHWGVWRLNLNYPGKEVDLGRDFVAFLSFLTLALTDAWIGV